MQPTPEDIRARIAEALGVRAERVTPDAPLTDLVSDSYRLVEMAIELQEDYDVVFTQADLSAVSTVGDLTELVRSRLP